MRREQTKESLLEDSKQTKQMTRGEINKDGQRRKAGGDREMEVHYHMACWRKTAV